MNFRRFVRVAGAALVGGTLVSCDAPLRAPSEGGISPRIALVEADSITRAQLILPLQSVSARAIGPTPKTIDLEQSGGQFTGRITGLSEGAYEVIIEGRAGGQVQYYGRTNATVTRGQQATPGVTFAPAIPVVNDPPLPNTASFSQVVPFTAVNGATGYVIEWSTSPTFAGASSRALGASETSPLITVDGPGTWNVRTRATLPQTSAADIPWSNTRSWTVFESPGGDNPGEATGTTLVPETPEVVTERNITATKTEDWFDVTLFAGDTLVAETRAARLTPNSSALDTRVTLFRNDGVTEVASDDNGAGTDSRLRTAVPDSGTYKLRVDGVNNTRGHYEITIEIRRLPLAPSALVSTVVSGTQVDLAWQDNSNNETGFVVDRCLGTTCSPTPLDTLPAGTTAFSDNALTQDNNYRWRVRAINNVGTSGATAIVNANTFGPAAPTALGATTISVTQIDLAWTDNATNEVGYEVDRCAGAACDVFTKIADLPANAVSYSDVTGLVYNETYRYRVRAVNNVIPSPYADVAEATTIPPATPTSLSATVQSGTRIDLAWTDNASNESGFLIERCSGAGCTSFAQIASIAADAVAYQDNGVTPGNDYVYRIRAFNAVVSNTYSGTAVSNTRAPVAPATLSATLVNGNRIDLAWTDASLADAPSTGFTIERCGTAGCTNFAQIAGVPTTPTTYSDLTVVPGATYRYRVAALGVAGTSAFSNTATTNTILPDAPTGLTVTTISGTQIDLAWTDASNNETAFEIQRCSGVGCADFPTIVTVAAGSTTYSDLTVVPGLSYTYRVRAQNLAGYSAFTADGTSNTQLPDAPTALTATAVGPTQVDLAWTNNTANATQIEIERCTGAGCADFAALAQVAPGVTTFSDLTATLGNVYQYQVRATNAVGSSSYAGPAAATTETPAAPATLLSGVTSGTEINLFWTLSTGPNVTSQEILRCTGVGCTDLTVIDTADPADGVYSDITVTAGNDYRYIVRALNVAGTGAPSDTVAANTRTPNAPSDVAVAISTGRVTITWTDNSDNETRFIVRRCSDLVSCTSPTDFAVEGSDTTVYVDSTLNAFDVVDYFVVARNNVGSSAFAGGVRVDATRPEAPFNLVATTQSQTEIALAWENNSIIETGFVVERCAGAACTDFAFVDSLPADAVSYLDGGLTADESYSYRVFATVLFGRSLPSDPATSTTFVPAAPNGLTAETTSDTSVTIQWTDASNNETGFSIERCDGAACDTFVEIATVAADVVMYGDSTLTAESDYRYRVRAFNASGTSAASDPVDANTRLPAAPSALVAYAVAVDGSQLFWTNNAGDAIDQHIERCEGAACDTFAEVAVVPNGMNTYQENGLVPSATYNYRVRVRNGAGYSAYSDPFEVTIAAPGAPASAVATTLSATSVQVTWADVTNNEQEFVVLRCTGVGCVDFANIASLPENTTEYIDTSAEISNSYAYQILSNNALGWSPPSNVATANTFPPDAPTDLVATTFSATRIDLTWTDNGPYESGFEIERCSGAACTDFALVATTAAGATSYQDAGLTSGVFYRYQVRAINAVDSSAYTAIAEAETDLPADPTELAAVAASGTRIELTWTDNADNETGYIVERCSGLGCLSFAQIALLGPNVGGYADDPVAADQNFSYRVQAFNGSGTSAYSGVASTNTFAPLEPTDLVATTVSGSQINLSWTENANNELAISVERCAGAACLDFVEIVSLAPDANAYEDLGVAVDAEYTYRVRAINNVAASAYTLEVSANTLRPASPSNFTATTISGTQINLVWDDNAANEELYRIQRCEGEGCADFTDLVEVSPNVTGYEDLSAVEGTIYRYQIFGVNVAGLSDAIAIAEATTLLPAVPTGVTALVVSSSQIDLSWVDNADNEDGYRIEQCAGPGCSSFIEIGLVGPDETFLSVTGLAGNTLYSFRVRAYNAAGVSAYSAVENADTFAPATPSSLVATTVFGGQVDLTWTDVAGNEAGYRIERCVGASCVDFAEIGTTGENQATFEDLGVVPATEYRYRVRAYNGVNNSGYSNIDGASTLVPASPTGVAAVATSTTSVQLTWTDVATDEAAYRIERCEGVACSDFVEVGTLGADATGFDDVAVTDQGVFRYRVRATGNGSSEYSDIVEVTTILPDAPTALTAGAYSDTRIDLTWIDNATNEFGFEIARCAGAACTPTTIVATVGADVTAFSDETLTPGETYSYRVRAYNGAGPSGYSEPPAEALTNVPAFPTALSGVTDSDTQISLSWTDNSSDETGFVVDRCVGAGCFDFLGVTTTAADVTGFIDTGLDPATTYRYRIRAENANGLSGPSNFITITTGVPAQPTDLVAATVSATQIDLSWTDVADNETGYTVERCLAADCPTFAFLATLAAGSTAYSDASAVVEESYTYRIIAFNDVGNSLASGEATANTFTPAAPTDLSTTTVSATQVDLTWTDNADNETEYRLERCLGATCTDFALVATLPADATAYSDIGLADGQTFLYRLYAVNIAGNSGFSAEVAASTDFPLPPSDLSAVTVTGAQIDLSWTDNSSNEAQFLIQRCVGSPCVDDIDFTEIAQVGTDVATYSDTDVSVGNEYRYKVQAINLAGVTTFTNVAYANTILPPVPTFASAEALSSTSIRLSWALDTLTNGVFIERCEGVGCESFAPVADVTDPTDEYTDVGLTAGLTYRYHIIRYNAAGTTEAVDTALVALLVPTPPSGLTGFALSGTQNRLTWSDNSPDETGFTVRRCTGPGCVVFDVTVGSVGANELLIDDAGLAPGQTYGYQVSAENALGSSANSATFYIVMVIPANASGLAATTLNGSSIGLTWNDNSNDERGFVIERCAGVLCFDFAPVATVGPNQASYNNTGLSLNTVYSYRVRSFNNIGPSVGYTNTATANTLVPVAPTGLSTATLSGTSVRLNWTDNATTETGYRVFRCETDCGDPLNFSLVTELPANSITFDDTGLVFGTVYRYVVRAFNIAGPSLPSNVVTGSTALPVPASVVAKTADRTSVAVRWFDNAAFETGFEIESCEGGSCTEFAPLGSVGAGVTEYIATSLNPASEYRFRVRAISADGNGEYSGGRLARTPIEIANDAVVTGISDFSLGERHWVFTVPPGTPQLKVQMYGGTGDPDLYVRVTQSPQTLDFFDTDTLCAPYVGGTTESCTFTNPGDGDWYVMLQAYSPYSDVSFAVIVGNTEFTFTNCAQVGFAGPSQAQCDAAYTGTALTGGVTVTGGIQSWVAPFNGRYEMVATGAAGASGQLGFTGGRGAQMAGEFELTQGTPLQIAVGQMGLGVSSGSNGGGGGGSFIVSLANDPLLIAGGGGGTRTAALQNGCDATTVGYATTAAPESPSGGCAVKNTELGLGGLSLSPYGYGASGAGFLGNGQNDDLGGTNWGFGGSSWANGLFGGIQAQECGFAAHGGFGGGGSGNGCAGGGGGGGYSGGNGGWIAGGGGSFNAGTNQNNIPAVSTGHGSVIIRYLGPAIP